MMIYRNLYAELIKSGVDIRGAASAIGVTAKTMRAKLFGKSDWTWSEVKKLRKLITTTNDLDYIFQAYQSGNDKKSA